MPKYSTNTESGECVFCEIAKGNIETPGVFWEDSNYMAFLSIFPNTEGFSVVMPKDHYGSDVLAMEDDKLAEFVQAAKKVSKVLLEGLDDVGRVGLIMEGTGINHAHIKLFPMHGTEHMKRGEWKQYSGNKSNYFKEYQGYIVSADGPKADPDELERLAEKLRQVNVKE